MKPRVHGWGSLMVLAAVICAPLHTTPAQAQTEPLAPMELYAYRFPIELESDADWVTITLPLEFYRSVTDPHLRDSGVFNAAGQAVPRMFKHKNSDPASKETRTDLTALPLFSEADKAPERLRFLIEQSQGGTTLQLDTQQSKSPNTDTSQASDGDSKPAPQALQAYIIDLRDFDQPFDALDLTWDESAQGFVGTVTVSHSNDLQRWRRAGQGSVADLLYQDTRILRNRLDLQRSNNDFLRITWQGLPANFRLQAIQGIRRQSQTVERQWLELAPLEISEDGLEYRFDAGGFPPLDRVNLLMAPGNAVVRASVLYRENEKDAWQRAAHGVFYQISRDDTEIRSETVSMAPARAPQWLVRIESGAVTGPIRLQLGWPTEQLLFLAQGPAPFTLVSGRAHERLEGFALHSRMGDHAIFNMLEDSAQTTSATLGQRQLQLAGALEVSATLAWRVALVWLGLFAAVALVGWLVLSLLREQTSPP